MTIEQELRDVRARLQAILPDEHPLETLYFTATADEGDGDVSCSWGCSVVNENLQYKIWDSNDHDTADDLIKEVRTYMEHIA